MELLAVLAGVGGGGVVDHGTPECTLVVGDRGWVRAAVLGGWVEGWVALNVDVEAGAGRGGVAVGGTSADVVGSQGLESKVGCGGGGCVVVNECLGVARWSLGVDGLALKDWVGVEGINSVWDRDWSGAYAC